MTLPIPTANLGGEPPLYPGELVPGKLPPPTLQSRVPTELRTAWVAHMLGGFKNNEMMFKRTLDAFLWPYYLTIGMYIALFVLGLSLFGVAAVLGWRDPQSLATLSFAGLGVGAFVAFFARQPLQALEENLEFIAWLGVAFNTYWTRLMYLTDQTNIQADLKAAEDDYVRTVKQLIKQHAALRARRPGTDLETAMHPDPGADHD